MEEKKRRSVQNKRVTRPDRPTQQGAGSVEERPVAERPVYRQPQQPVERRQYQRPAESPEHRRPQPAESCQPRQAQEPRPARTAEECKPQAAGAKASTNKAAANKGAASAAPELKIPGISPEKLAAFQKKVRPVLRDLGKKAGKVGKTMGPVAHKAFDIASPLSDNSFKIRGIVAAILLAFVLIFTVAGIPQAAQLTQLQSTVNQQTEELATLTAQNEHDQQVVDARDAALEAYQS